MIRVTYHDRLEAAPVVNFHSLAFKHGEPVEVPDDWSGLEAVRTHPHFSVDNGHAKAAAPKPIDKVSEPIDKAISIGEARARGREAHASGHHRKAPAHFSQPQRKAWLEGFDRARRKART
jgi:hypothetical protein